MEVLEEGEIDGIQYKIIATPYATVVKVKCPRCGKWGNLRKDRGKRFIIVHERSHCHFGWTRDAFEVLEKIYRRKFRIE